MLLYCLFHVPGCGYPGWISNESKNTLHYHGQACSLSEPCTNAGHCTSPWQRGQTCPGSTIASTSLWRGTAARILPTVIWPELVFSINTTPLWHDFSSIQMRTNNKITNSSNRQCLGRKLRSYRVNVKNNISVKVKKEFKAACIVYCHILRFCVVVSADICVFEG